jgi:hypothetical protein
MRVTLFRPVRRWFTKYRQMIIRNQQVVGSSPTAGSSNHQEMQALATTPGKAFGLTSAWRDKNVTNRNGSEWPPVGQAVDLVPAGGFVACIGSQGSRASKVTAGAVLLADVASPDCCARKSFGRFLPAGASATRPPMLGGRRSSAAAPSPARRHSYLPGRLPDCCRTACLCNRHPE